MREADYHNNILTTVKGVLVDYNGNVYELNRWNSCFIMCDVQIVYNGLNRTM